VCTRTLRHALHSGRAALRLRSSKTARRLEWHARTPEIAAASELEFEQQPT
jgi:hypothetical protein